jgi:hypothetical protein
LPPAGHVRRNGHSAQPPGLRDDLRLALMVLGVEHLMLHAALVEQIGQPFALLYRHRAHQNRSPWRLDLSDLVLGDRLLFAILGRLDRHARVVVIDDLADVVVAVLHLNRRMTVEPLDLVGKGGEFLALRAVDDVLELFALHRTVGRYADDVELVDLPELAGLGEGRTRHPRDLLIELEEVLQCDRGERLILFFDRYAFFGLNGLVQPVAPLPTFHESTRKLVDDDDPIVIGSHVIDVELVEVVRLERVVDQVRPLQVASRVEALDPGELLRLAHAILGEVSGVLLLLNLEVDAFLKLPRNLVGLYILGHVVARGAGDDQRRPCLVDQDVVHLVDDGKVEHALRLLIALGEPIVPPRRRAHVVAQVVEAEFVVRAVRDIARVRFLPLARVHAALDVADGQAQVRVDRPHPLHVAAGEVVVDGNYVNALALNRVEIRGERGDQRLAFAGHHLGDVPFVEDHPAHQLDVVMAHAQEPAAALTHCGKGLDQDVVQRLPVVEPFAELDGLAPQLVVRQLLVLVLERVDRVDLRLQPTQEAGVRRAKQHGDRALESAQDRIDDPADDFPNSFKNFHRQLNIKPEGTSGAGSTCGRSRGRCPARR